MRRNGDRGLCGGDREILDRGLGFHRTGDRWLPDRWLGMPGGTTTTPPPDVILTTWPDSSGKGHTATGIGSPILVQSVLNTFPVVRFRSASSDGFNLVPVTVTRPFQVVSVMKAQAVGKVLYALAGNGVAGIPFHLIQSDGAVYASNLNEYSWYFGLDLTSWHVWTVDSSLSAFPTLWLDGVNVPFQSHVGSVTAGTFFNNLGYNNAQGVFSDGDIAEMSVFAGERSADSTGVEKYFGNKYGITIGTGAVPVAPNAAVSNLAWWSASSLWIPANLTDGAAVSEWPDSSGNGHHARQTGTARPTLKTNIKNGKPVVRFSSAAAQLLNVTSPIPSGSGYTIFVVQQCNTGKQLWNLGNGVWSSSGMGLMLHENGNLYQSNAIYGQLYWAARTDAGLFHVYTSRIGGGDNALSMDGTDKPITYAGGVADGLPYSNIGSTVSDGDIAEIIIYSSTMGLRAKAFLLMTVLLTTGQFPTEAQLDAMAGKPEKIQSYLKKHGKKATQAQLKDAVEPMAVGDRANIEKYLGTKYGIAVAAGTAVDPATIPGMLGWWKADSLISATPPGETSVLLHSWPLSNQNDIGSYQLDPYVSSAGQSFTSAGGKITSVKFGLKKNGSPTGSVVATLYAGTGSFPTVKPTGTALATSDPVDVTTISGTVTDVAGAWVVFSFTGANQFQMVNGTKYVICVEPAAGTVFTSTNKIGLGCDFEFGAGAQHPGNYTNKWQGTWSADDMADMVFELWGVGTPGVRMVDKWEEEEQTHVGTYYGLGVVSATMPTPQVKVGQAITSDGYKLLGCRFFLKRIGAAATTNLVVRLYECVGIPGTNGEPTGLPLVTSEPIAAASVTDVDGDMYDFVFTGENQINIPAGGKYCFSLEEEVEGSLGADSIQPGFDMVGLGETHPGNMFFQNLGAAPYALGDYDMTFYLVGGPIEEVEPPSGPELIDSNPIEGMTDSHEAAFRGNVNMAGQSITGRGGYLHSLVVHLRQAYPTTIPWNVVAKLYPANGTVGGNAIPMQPPLATSQLFDASVVQAEVAPYEFVFDDTCWMWEGEGYFIAVELVDPLQGRLCFASQFGSGTHYGSYAERTGQIWVNSGTDLIFYLYAIPGETPEYDQPFEDANVVENMNDGGSYGFFTNTIWGVAESFTAHKGGVLQSIRVYAKQNLSNVDHEPLTARIYESTLTVDQAIPEGTPLASSDPFDSSVIGTGEVEPIEFLFTGANQIQFVKDKVYCLAIERPNSGSMDVIRFGYFNHTIRPGHPGVYSQNKTSWDKDYCPGFDMTFYVFST